MQQLWVLEPKQGVRGVKGNDPSTCKAFTHAVRVWGDMEVDASQKSA